MKRHYFQEDREAEGKCELCGESADSALHEMEFEPPDEPDSGFDVREPETVADLFETYGRELP